MGGVIVKRASKFIEILLCDKGYDDQKLRKLCHELGVRPMIKHREFTSLHKAWNARPDEDLYKRAKKPERIGKLYHRKKVR